MYYPMVINRVENLDVNKSDSYLFCNANLLVVFLKDNLIKPSINKLIRLNNVDKRTISYDIDLRIEKI